MSEPCFHDNPELNRIFQEVTEELRAMSPEELVELLKATPPGPISMLLDEIQSTNNEDEGTL